MHPAAILLLVLAATLWSPSAGAQSGAALRGRVVPADGGSVAGLRAYLRTADGVGGRAPAWADSADVDAAGRFRIPLPRIVADSLTLVVDAADPAARTHYAVLARMAAGEADREHGIVLVPRVWTITAGSYAGERVPVSPDLARRPACATCSSFWVRMPTAREGFQGWPPARFPLRMAFDRAESEPPGAAPDSAVFWRAAASVERALGRDVFRPVSITQALSGVFEDREDLVLVRVDGGLWMSGRTTTVGSRGDVEYAGVTLRRAGAVLEAQGGALVAHELMHALGLGHTCAWRSVLAEARHCPARQAPVPTAEDVAYTQLLYRVRELQRDQSLRWGLDASLAGERMLAGRTSGAPDGP